MTGGALNVEALKVSIAHINKQKEKASEYSGLAGKATAEAVEQHNFDKKALTFVAQLARKEPAQQEATLCAIVQYAEAMGMFAHVDMFNDAIGAMKNVIANAEGASGKGPAPNSGVIAQLAAVN